MLIKNKRVMSPYTDDQGGNGGEVTDGDKTQPGGSEYDDRLGKLEKGLGSLVNALHDSLGGEPTDKQQQAIDNKNLDAKDESGKPLFNEAQKQAIREMVRSETKSTAEESSRESQREALAKEYDTKTYAMYPDLNDTKSEFFKEVKRIRDRHAALDKSATKRPDLIWSAAHEAEINLRNQNKPVKKVESTMRKENEGNYSNNRQRFLTQTFIEGSSSRGGGGVGASDRNDSRSDSEMSQRRITIRQKLGTDRLKSREKQ